NLKQIGIALHTYYDTHKVFPPAKIGVGAWAAPATTTPPHFVVNTTGWSLMLPQLEQQAIASQWNYAMPSSLSSFAGGTYINNVSTTNPPNPNGILASNRLETLTCPSDTYPAHRLIYQANVPNGAYESNNAARSNYLFSTGGYVEYSGRYSDYGFLDKGMFGNDGAGGLQDCTDGTSNTIAIGESKQGNRGKTSTVYGPFWGSGTHTCCHGYTPRNQNAVIMNSGNLSTLRPTKTVTNGSMWNVSFDYVWDFSNRQYAWGFGSYHPNGGQFVMCDGAVKFINQNIQYDGGVGGNVYGGVFVWLNRPADNLSRTLKDAGVN
ncbi:MAG: DUF1559 domain-containing protein, partial [Planctomycetales bacterium]|nr:DUF1559 domain-containing protein [Planctomycetales bacterium]